MDDKCAPTICAIMSEAQLQRPEAYMISAEDVLVATEGKWVADSLTLVVERGTGKATYQEPIHGGQEHEGEWDSSNIPEQMWTDCAKVGVPATVTITDSDAPDEEPVVFQQLVVHGYELAEPGTSPTFSDTDTENRVLGFPTVPGFYFGVDGVLWKLKWPAEEATEIGGRIEPSH
jgi:hypothetical protein